MKNIQANLEGSVKPYSFLAYELGLHDAEIATRRKIPQVTYPDNQTEFNFRESNRIYFQDRKEDPTRRLYEAFYKDAMHYSNPDLSLYPLARKNVLKKHFAKLAKDGTQPLTGYTPSQIGFIFHKLYSEAKSVLGYED